MYESLREDGKKIVALGIALVIAGLLIPNKKPPATTISVPIPQYTGPVSPLEIVNGDTSKKQIIFTFDGGAGDDSTTAILAALAKHKVKGTFFLTGKFIENFPDMVKAIDAGGNEIFSHTYSHPHLTSLSDEEIKTELDKMNDLLKKTIGKSAHPYFRPPYGDRDKRVREVAAALGYEDVFWTVDALDWQESSGMTDTDVEGRILRTAAPGNIYLMHLGDTITGAILDDVISKLESRGYTVVSLTEGLSADQIQGISPERAQDQKSDPD